MFRLVIGTAGSGKSRYCLEQVTSLAEQGKGSVIVVPEQTGFTYEREIVERLPGVLGARTRVMSFRSISRHVMRECGGSALIRLGDAQKAAFARRAVLKNRSSLTCYSKSREFSFYTKLSSLFDELRSAGAAPQDIREIGEGLESSMSREKFADIALIMQEYEESMGDSYLDEAGEIRFAAGKIPQSDLFRGKAVFFDAFSGFTAAETEMIRQIAMVADCVTVSLCCTGSRADERSAAAAAFRTSEMITSMSLELSGKRPDIIPLPSNDRFAAEGLLLAERYFRDYSVKQGGDPSGVRLIAAGDRYDEAERVADEIVSLVRDRGYSYKEIAVLFRDPRDYREPVLRTFSGFGIPFIFDEGEDMLSAPGTVFMLSAFEMAEGVRTESLLRLLKTGLCDITPEEISLVEDYSFVHGTEGDGWFREFNRKPSGFGVPESEDEKSLILRTESVRKKICGWIRPFLSGEPGSGEDIVRRTYELMERCGAAEAIERDDRAGRLNADLMFGLIQQMYDIAEREELSRTELSDTLRILAMSTRSSDIPRVGDGVFIGIAGHSRPFNPKVCFVMGLNDGVFPRDVSEGNLFTMEERDILTGHDLILGGSFDQNTDLEAYYLYDAVTSASERLYLSYAGSSGGGEMMPCSELEGFIKAYGITAENRSRVSGIVNMRTARQAYAEALSSGDNVLTGSLLESDAGDICREYGEAVRRGDLRISDRAVAEALAGNTTGITASRMETFEQCRFMYFLQYLLGIRPLKKAEMSPDEAGSFVHDVMEKLMREFSGDLAAADESAVRNACRRLADEYISALVGDGAVTPRMRVVSEQIKENCIRLAERLRKEQKQSRFRASGLELNIGQDIPAPVYELEDGSTAKITGKIDRVDTYVSGGETYVRVVDYKTGGKDFKLSDVWQGLNVQMLLYLFALKNSGDERYGSDVVPAGVLYMPGDPAPASDEEGAAGVYTMKGIVLNRPEVLEAMEEKGEGIFIPAEIDQKTGRWKNNLASLEELGKLENRIEELIREMASGIRSGDVRAYPAERSGKERPCRYCPYAAVCGADRITEVRKITNLSRAAMFGEEETDG